MRSSRLALIFVAVYLTFLGGRYDSAVPALRVFHHAVVTLLLALWLAKRLRSGQGLPRTPLDLPIYALAVVWLLSSAVSIDPRMAFENLWPSLVHIMIFYVIVDLMQRGRQRLVMEILFFVATLVVLVSGVELAAWYVGFGNSPETSVGWADVIGPGAWIPLSPKSLWWAMGVTTWLAAYTALTVVVAGVWSLTARRHDHRPVLRVLAGLLLVVLILTFSRGGLLAVVASMSVLLVMRLGPMLTARRNISRRTLSAAIGFGALGTVALLGIIVASQTAGHATGDLRRVDMWSSSIKMIRDRTPLGIGPGMFGRAYRVYRNPAIVDDRIGTAHDLYLNTAAETGLVGTVVGAWIGIAFVRAWRDQWKGASGGRRFRLEAAFAALLGAGVQSLFDVYTTTPVVLPILVLVTYCITEERPALQNPVSTGQRWSLVGALAIVVAYGIAFVPIDLAHLRLQESLRGGETALASAKSAAELDPLLRLYRLQIDYLSAQQSLADCPTDLSQAVAANEDALELEPTWDTGWINLASLAAREGDLEGALNYLDQARRIKHSNSASLHWARLAEQANSASPDDILDAYVIALRYDPNLPLSDFWSQTAPRRQAVARYLEGIPADLQYRVLAQSDPEAARGLVKSNPASAAEWWVVGENALSVDGLPAVAIASFAEAIRRDPTNGDYYVSRARAELDTDPDAALRDLDIARLLGTRFEYPNAVRVKLAESPEEVFALRANALPGRVIEHNFEGVLFGGRVAYFEVSPDMRRPGPGTVAMQPWYDVAADYLAEGETERAVEVYRAILDYAPDEAVACQQLARHTEGDTGPFCWCQSR